ncbi:LolA family protein [Umboniibacter marinipuniceus]|uniref:Outer membrane lipoprotein carrier protein LolA n=1 Tax=Umboniibacter marinipuniceus TaxID=569599 RepID=A0A3M0AU56_9GAMM|nr:hypothetical protein [Umboniibacter marinipuniceus]RMA82482.1 hypothetical protein DFR27_0431 [Umboniibacter marinipuniceus]
MIKWLASVVGPLLLLLPSAHADEALERVKDTLASTAESYGVFEQSKTIASLSRPLNASGKFLFEQHRGVVWLTEEPFLSQQCWTADSTSSSSASYWVSAIFAGDFAKLSRFFEVTAQWQDEAWKIRLVPLNEAVAAVISAVEVSGSQHLERIVYREVGGHSTEIKLRVLAERPDINWTSCP